MAESIPGAGCSGCLQLSQVASDLKIEMAEMKGANDARYAVIQEKMNAHVDDFDDLKMSIKECVVDLREGSKTMRDGQSSIKLQNLRLKEGEDRFQKMEQSAEDHLKGDDSPHNLIEKAFDRHVNGDRGEHTKIDKSLSRIIKLLAILLAYLVLSGHGVKFLEFMVKLKSVWPA